MSGVLPPRDHDEWIVSLGSYVEDIDFQRRGRVTALFETFDTTGMNIDWLAYQSRHVNEAQFKAPWAEMLVHRGGSATVPVSFLRVIQPFPLIHEYAAFYFGLNR